MCTISWFVEDGEYSVFFNRDESIIRPRATLPAIYSSKNQKMIMPVDPQGKGSWITVNDSGYTFALLNYYQGRLPKGRLQSRGQIIKTLAKCENYQQVEEYFSRLNPVLFAPFTILIFTPELADSQIQTPEVPMCRWDGKNLEMLSKSSPHFSSAVNFDYVCEVRQAVYAEMISEQKKPGKKYFEALHRSHLPEKSRLSICMHRLEANTVSFSEVSVNNGEIRFAYSDGAPCVARLKECARLPRRSVF